MGQEGWIGWKGGSVTRHHPAVPAPPAYPAQECAGAGGRTRTADPALM